MTPFIGQDAEAHLDWLSLTDALAAGHRRPKAEIGDTFLYRDPDTLLSRSAWIDGLGMAVKTATVFPGNAGSAINGAVSLFSDTNGVLEAILDFHLVTKWKTAGDSLLAARRLARPDSQRVTILGAGTVAASLIEAYRAAFPSAQVTVCNRTTRRAVALAAKYNCEVSSDPSQAVAQADIVACATMSTEPVLRGDWIRPGTHIDLIGAYRADMREADDDALRRARVFVDSFATTLDHIGELKIPIERGAFSREEIVADFYDLDLFRRRSPDEITLCKNGGGAHLDLMTCRYILDSLP